MGAANGLSSSTAATLLINSWFYDRKALALGIASAGTGIASITAPLILVPIIENVSLTAAFLTVAAFVLVCTAIIFVIVKDDSPIKLVVRGQAVKRGSSAQVSEADAKLPMLITSRPMSGAFAAATFLGAVVVYGVTGCLSLILTPNFSGTEMSRIVSIFGLFLMLGKIAYGQLADKVGAFRANFFMFSMLLAGFPIICLAKSFPLAALGAACLGLGSPISNVATPLYVSDLSSKAHYPRALKISNMVMNCSGILTNFAVGRVADAFGGYVPVFAGLGAISVICVILLQLVYIKTGLTGKPKA
jgi:MFS family permease